MVVVFSFCDSTLQDWPDVSVFSLVVLGRVDVWVLEAVMCKAVSGVEGGVGVGVYMCASQHLPTSVYVKWSAAFIFQLVGRGVIQTCERVFDFCLCLREIQGWRCRLSTMYALRFLSEALSG